MKQKQYYIAQARDCKTGKVRSMSMLAVYPLIDAGIEMGDVAETMLSEFINDSRPAPDVMSKYHFFNWCFLQQKYAKNSHIDVPVFVLGNRAQFDFFNKLINEGPESVA